MTTDTLERPLIQLQPVRHYVVAIDGACRGNPGPGGWGAHLISYEGEAVRGTKDLSGALPDTTNNQMELTAAIEALNFLKNRAIPVTLITDSQYVVNGMTKWIEGWQAKGWRGADGKPVKNQDLWEALLAVSADRMVDWVRVRGHSGHALNERADALATKAIDRLLRP